MRTQTTDRNNPVFAYLALPMDGKRRDWIQGRERIFQRVLGRLGIVVEAPYIQGIDNAYTGAKKHLEKKIVREDLRKLRTARLLVVDFSHRKHTYIGCCCEMVYAHLLGIPVFVYAGRRQKQARVWMTFHASRICTSLDDLQEAVRTTRTSNRASLAAASPFMPLRTADVLVENRWAVAFFDRYPVAEGHTLVVPRRSVRSLYDLPEDEHIGVWSLVRTARCELLRRFEAKGFNIGINDGALAGQTIPHAHVHVIPRYKGDVADPRGGVRWVLPRKAAYWSSGRGYR